MPHDPYKALYIHIPFCVRRCNYCDFSTQAIDPNSNVVAEYVEKLVLQIRQKSKEGELSAIETVYIGGGTPTHIGNARLSELLYALSISMHLTEDVEFTIEANPESLDERMVADIWAMGVNRISIGVQSFDDAMLEMLGRAHTAARAIEAVEIAKTRFSNISIDLMCGLPGQTLSGFENDLMQAIELGISHISIYPLTVEDHTVLSNMVLSGQIEDIDEDIQADMMKLAARILTEHGFQRYEVASYAKPGFESRHNISYWTGKSYLGLGYSATTMTQNAERRMRVQDDRVTDDLNARQMAAEDLMLGMRMSCGVDDSKVNQVALLVPETSETLEGLVDDGLVEHNDGRWYPTERGWLFGNDLYGTLLELAP